MIKHLSPTETNSSLSDDEEHEINSLTKFGTINDQANPQIGEEQFHDNADYLHVLTPSRNTNPPNSLSMRTDVHLHEPVLMLQSPQTDTRIISNKLDQRNMSMVPQQHFQILSIEKQKVNNTNLRTINISPSKRDLGINNARIQENLNIGLHLVGNYPA